MSAGVPTGVTPLDGWVRSRTSTGADLDARTAAEVHHGAGTCAGVDRMPRVATTPPEGPRLAGATNGCAGRVVASAVGIDLVEVTAFTDQLATPGTRLAAAFTDREHEHCRRSGDPSREAASLAARWAAKEAAVKAWSGLLRGQAPAMPEEGFEWHEIEVVADRWGRPALRFHGRVAAELRALEGRLGARLDWNLSLTHDGGYALAEVWVPALAGG